MKLNKKILTVILIFFGIIFLFSGKTFAMSVENVDYKVSFTDLNNKKYDLTSIAKPADSQYNKFFVKFNNFNQCFFYWFKDGNPNFYLTSSSLSDIGVLNTDSTYLTISFDLDTLKFNSTTSSEQTGSIGELNRPDSGYSDIMIKYSTFDIIANDNLVFQVPLEKMGLIPVEAIQPTQVQETIRQTLQILIPIALIILSALVVIPIVIKKIIKTS